MSTLSIVMPRVVLLALLSLWALSKQSVALLIQQEQLVAVSQTAAGEDDRISMASAVALDFETNRVLDWVAYHHLIGVDCFVLFYDRNHCNFSIHAPRLSSSIVTLVNSTYQEKLGEETRPSVQEVADMDGGTRYLAVVDVDEFIVTDSNVSLKGMLKSQVSDHGRLGMYLNRWTFGTNGHVDPVNVSDMPEFFYLTERSGDENRTKAPHNEPRTGKNVLDLQTGVTLWGVHSWHPPAAHPS